VKEYWIGDPANKSLEILTLKEDRYELHCAAETQGRLTSLVLVGLEFDLTEIL
jgi:Uma2 family endonuclease